MKVYKVVKNTTGKKYPMSCVAPGAYSLEYKPHQRVEAPEGTKLFVFRDIVDAVDFVNGDTGMTFSRIGNMKSHHEVWEAEAGDSLEPVKRIAYTSDFSIRDYWAGYRLISMRNAPRGTFLCDWVKLKQKVDLVIYHDTGKGRIR